MNFSRQALLGIGMIIGGSVMLYAMVQQIGVSDNSVTPAAIVEKSSTEQASTAPLTIDVDTEKRILAQKQKERAARVAEQEKRAQLFSVEQESAEAQALAKARAENQQYVANAVPTSGDSDSLKAVQNTTVATPNVQPRTDTTTASTTNSTNNNAQKAKAAEQVAKQAEAKKLADSKKQADAKKQAEANAKKKAEAQTKQKKQAEEKAAAEAAKTAPPKSPTDYTVKSGDGLLKLARQHNVPVSALAQANDLSSSASLQIGQPLTIPSNKQIERLEREAAVAKKSADATREAQQKLSEARQEVKETNAKGSFGVQVALASNQAAADKLAKKLQSAGYQVKTSAASGGVRVVVGPERGKIAALALKDKINGDSQVNSTDAWVRYWD